MPPRSYIWQGPTFWQAKYPPYPSSAKVFSLCGPKYACLYVIRETWKIWLDDHSLPLESCPIKDLFTADLVALAGETFAGTGGAGGSASSSSSSGPVDLIGGAPPAKKAKTS
eukprot:TRINITY_DN32783_c0_g1_i3.p1 TRINITY_DN32783_c0_g1~~TRINITY_DN32783_c0_g1_i3.p1  ORF type:complete len:112 (-),score=14.78 TRINITY_DN32783_c0_g1_i3:8-343(-)